MVPWYSVMDVGEFTFTVPSWLTVIYSSFEERVCCGMVFWGRVNTLPRFFVYRRQVVSQKIEQILTLVAICQHPIKTDYITLRKYLKLCWQWGGMRSHCSNVCIFKKWLIFECPFLGPGSFGAHSEGTRREQSGGISFQCLSRGPI